MPQKIKYNDLDFNTAFQNILSLKRDVEQDVDGTVAEIIANVRSIGDEALFGYAKEFDNFQLDFNNIRIDKEKIDTGYAKCNRSFLDALQLAYARIKAFHERQLPESFKYVDDVGVGLEYRWTPIDSVGLYVPGGRASYPSSLLMNAIPALVAGVNRIVVCSPSSDEGIDPIILAAAKICGIKEIFCVGGAQAIAALAYGTQIIQPVCKIVGPGNSFVAAAKRQVFGQVGIDNIAGPSEILIICDNKNNPDWIAIDLLSQAEHDPTAQAILITDDEEFSVEVEKCIEKQLKTLKRSDIASESWEKFGVIILVKSLLDATNLINELAPEHLEIAIENPDEFVALVKNAGSIFLGSHTPEAIGDYIAGPNHVLPTSRSARFSSGLGVIDFMKRTSIIQCSKENIQVLGPSVVEMAEAEGLGAHARSIKMRLAGKTISE